MAASKLGDSWQDLQYSPFFCIFHDSDRTHCDTQLELITAAAAAYMEHKGGSAIRIRRPSCRIFLILRKETGEEHFTYSLL